MGVDDMSKYKVGSIVTGSVTGIEPYGVFVNLDDYYSGLIHISEISHGFVKDVNDYVHLGDPIKAKVIDVDDDTFHVKLSIKDINHKTNLRKREKISEVGSGFGILKDNLDDWVNVKKEETLKNSKN